MSRGRQTAADPPSPRAGARRIFLIALALQAAWLVFLLAMALTG